MSHMTWKMGWWNRRKARERDAAKDARIAELEGLLDSLRPHLDALPDGEWQTWTSCSFRRISRRGGGDGDVLHALNQRSDGQPDLSWSERQCDAICTIVNTLRALIAQPEEDAP